MSGDIQEMTLPASSLSVATLKCPPPYDLGHPHNPYLIRSFLISVNIMYIVDQTLALQ